LAGAIVLAGEMREVKPHADAEMRRYDEKGLQDVASFTPGPAAGRGGPGAFNAETFRQARQLQQSLRKFWADEKVAAIVQPSRGDGGTVFVQGGGNYQVGRE